MKPSEVLVIIPAHNEAAVIGELVRCVRAKGFGVVVINDGSSDATAARAAQAGAAVISHDRCRGKGAALKTGFRHALGCDCRAVITMDGDGQHLPADLDRFLERVGRSPDPCILVGTRKVMGTAMPWLRRLTNMSMSVLISCLSFQWMPDTQSGFRLIRRGVLERIPLVTSHFETESELLMRASWARIRVAPVPTSTVYCEEKSKIRAGRDTVRFCLMLAVILASSFRRRPREFR